MIYLLCLTIIVTIILLLLITRKSSGMFSVKGGRGRITRADKNNIVRRWKEVKKLVKSGGPSQLAQAILKADKIVDYTLKKLYPRETTNVGQYKKAEEFFKRKRDYNNLWYAHKVRNEIAHNMDFDLPHAQAVKVIYKFEKSLKIIGVLK